MNFGALAFLNPMLLGGLVALPLIWWLLRAVPPAPVRVHFPATRILVGLPETEKQSDRTPWWLTALRLLAAAALIFALAEPVLNPAPKAALVGKGPVVLVVDNGWTAAAHWADRRAEVEKRITEAEAQGRPVILAPTAFTSKTAAAFRVEAPAQARSTAAALEPQPFAPDRARAGEAIATALAQQPDASIIWLSDGVDHDGQAASFAERLVTLARGGSTILVENAAGQEALGVAASLGQGGRLEAHVIRTGGIERPGHILALSARGQRLGEAPFRLDANAARSDIRFDLPLELRNQVARIEIAGERSAGAVHLLDARAQWHRIGILSGASREQAQPLLAPLYYIERALKPFAEIARDEDANLSKSITSLIKRNVSVLVLADIGVLPKDVHDKVAAWVRKGGVLVRFAGPRLENGGDDLIPAPLRAGGRTLGGALSWSTPQALSPFTDDSLFVGLAIPPDVQVSRQVLADPARLGPETKILARLKDGTPLVTSARRGEGQLVLFHITANSDWSNLPLSGLFVEMLRRIATLGKPGGVGDVAADDPITTNAADQVAAETADVLAPTQVLDGYGILRSPPPTTQAITAQQLAEAKSSAEHPPGLYGPAASPRALNLLSPKSVLAPLSSLPSAFERRAIEGSTARPLKPHLLALGLGLLFIDILATLWLAGAFGAFSPHTASRAALVALAFGATLALCPADAFAAAQGSEFASRTAVAAELVPETRSPTSPAASTSTPAISTGTRPLMGPSASLGERTPDGQLSGLSPSVQLAQYFPQFPQQGRGLNLPPPRPPAAMPAGPDARAIAATSHATFGYVLSGDSAADTTSRQGLKGLATFLNAKTAVDPGEPVAVNIATDEITFFPILYWPVLPNAQALPETTLAKIDAYMKNGGMIIFDTRDAGTALPPGFTPQQQGGTPLQRLLGNLDIPRLEPVPETHVLTKSFYLLRTFPGRYDNGQLWVEAEAPSDSDKGRQARRVDGVSSILVTSNDFASAWALDDRSQPLYPVIPNGERQREMAFRVGVNIAMYALTGNYKADQVHVPALLERLGQ